MTPREIDLLHQYLSGSATEEDFVELQTLLRENAEARRMLRDLSTVETKLQELGALDPAIFALLASPPAEAFRPARPRWQWLPLAAAALMLLGGLCYWFFPRKPANSGAVEVEITGLADAKFTVPLAGVREHDRLRIDSLDLGGGEAHLRLPSGVQLIMSGTASLHLVDAMHAQVVRGKVTVDAGPHGKGFILDTPVTRVVDLGTRFGVEAKADGKTDVMVLDGRIELFNPQNTHRTAALEQGEAVRVDAAQELTRIVNITGGAQSTEWSTQPPPQDCNISSVSDNFGAAEGFHFYRIVPRGLRAGARVYTNRTHTWKADEGREFPASLADADLVQTFFGELQHPSYTIEIHVARPVTLFVLMPQRGIAAAWLTENFTRTGEILLLHEGGAEARPRLPFEVWKRTVPEAGTVTLGPGNRDANDRPVGMYGIAAKRL